MPEEQLEQQRLMMVTMDPPLHTRYRRLVNKGFTPRTISQLQHSIHVVADDIIDRVCETGTADFVIDVAADSRWWCWPSCSGSRPRTGTRCSTGPTA